MDAAQLEERIRLGEDSFNEFKGVARSAFLAHKDDLAKVIASFANARGGKLFLGIEDDGGVTGIGTREQADGLMRQVAQVCLDLIKPSLACSQQKFEVRGVAILIVEVPGFGPERPHLVQGIAYVRDANQSRPATRDEQVRLLESADHHFDEQPVDGSRIDDLDAGAVEAFLNRHYSAGATTGRTEHYLRELGCASDDGVPTVAGILFLATDPIRWLRDARITAVRIAGTQATSDFLDRKEIGGRLLDQIEAAIAFLETHVPAPSSVKGWNRVEHGIPTEAFREALLNAVAHRDYRKSSQVRIFVFDDRVEIINPGMLLNRLTLGGIRNGGISQRRNPVIASLVARTARRESIGFGVPDMIVRMRERGLPEPEFDLQAGHFRVVLRATPLAK